MIVVVTLYIEGRKICDKFKQIYASEFFYNEDGNAMWPKLAVNYTNKTQYLTRINKGILDLSDNRLNNKIESFIIQQPKCRNSTTFFVHIK